MAADVALDFDASNPCCTKLKKKFQKLEASRNALRQAVHILEQQVDKLEGENAKLQKVCQQHEDLEPGKKANEEEPGIILKLEKEIYDLKAEITAYHQQETKVHGKMPDVCISERDVEIKLLKEELVKEKERGDSEKKRAEVEKKKAAEGRKLLETEQRKAQEQRKLAETERKKAEELELSLVRLRTELTDAKTKITMEKKLFETEKRKAEEQRKLAVTEQKKAEELKPFLERLRTELTDIKTKLMTERAKTQELDKSIEAEKHKTMIEKNHADFERGKSKELSSSLEAQCIELREQKINVERMKQMLEDRNKKIEDLEKKLNKVMSNLGSAHDKKMKLVSSDEVGIIRSLKQQLKFEKKRVKYAKRMVKLEKAEKVVIVQQLHLVQQDFMQLSCHLKMLGDQLSHRNEGTHGFAKVDGSGLKLNLRSALHSSQSDLLQGKLYKGSPSSPGSFRKCCHFDVSGGQCIRSIAGTQFALESVGRNSFGNKQQSSTVCSTSATCSDMMSLQGIDAVFLATRNTQDKRPVVEEYKVTDKVFFVNGKKREKQELLGLDNSFCYKDKHFHKDPLPSVSEGNKVSDSVEVHVGSKKRKKRDPGALDKSSCHKNTGFHKDPLTSVSEGKKATGNIVDVTGKKTRKQDPLTLDKSLSDKDKQFHIGKTELPTGRKLIRNPVGLPKPNSHAKNGIPKTSNNWRGQLAEIHDGMCGKFQGSLKNSKDKQETSCLQCSNPGQMHQSENNYPMVSCNANKSSSISLIMKEVNPSTREEDIGAISDNQADFVCSKNINLQDCMTLLMLDNEDDERRYMEAVERPVSPTLPEIRISNGGKDQSHCLVDSIFRKPISEVTCEPCCYFDVIDLEINSNKLELLTPNPPVPKDAIGVIHASEDSEPDSVLESQRDLNKNEIQPLVSKCTQGFVHTSEESEPNCALIVQRDLHNTEPLEKSVQKFDHGETMSLAVGKAFCDRVVTVAGQSLMSDDFLGAGKVDNNQVSNYNVVARSDSRVHLSASQEVQNPHGNTASLENTNWCCVVFSDCKDESISRIVQARNIVASQNFRSSQVDCSIVEVLQSLKSLSELQPEEKVCVFFSLMLGNISGRLRAYPESMMASNILQFAKSLSVEIDKVFSDATTCQLFLEVCKIDVLLDLLEDFIIKRRILMCKGVESEQSCSVLSSNFFHAKCGDMFVTQNAAKTNQLLATSIFCASICSMLDQIGFLVETSYKVLTHFKCDTSCNLLILHIFALVSGEKFFTMEKYSFLAIVLKSVISILEEGYETMPSGHLTSDVDISFSPCEQCPFSKEIACTEKITSSLMDILHDFAFSGNSSTSSIFPLSREPIAESSHGAEDSIHCSRVHDKSNQCESSCALFKHRCHADQTSSSTPERVTNYAPMKPLCYIIDVVSAIELFSLYMGWKWTSDNILPRILAMLKLCPSSEFSVAAVVLIGQLGRFGVDYGGYQEISVSQLRCNLSSLLKASLHGKNSLPNQLAIINALVNLLPLSFKEIVDRNHEHLVDAADQFQEIKVVKEWFAQLDKKMQVIVLNFSGHAV
ncbi:uncharacterized protein LOC122055692 isoform X1 [Zingiber officinale]|uniref:uncharacterized protein LOC122055692 isoform X1 n=1 Tax=Zingiber officinale TaxID=94328 RepID=UPI001C4CE5A9|nr:uncharacterized protein LOC122055692 isoform X1 [Zingiber officinale]